jgi:cytochrome c biogenesis protein
MHGGEHSFTVQGNIGGSSQITDGQQKLTLEYTNLRVINVENLSAARAKDEGIKRKTGLVQDLARSLGAADRGARDRDLHNVGPSITYRLRDEAGQAREYNNYMLPIKMGDGVPEFLLGVRSTEAEPFRYLRIPADDNGSMEGFIRLQEALHNPDMRAEAVQRYVAKAVGSTRPALVKDLTLSAGRALDLFAGTEAVGGAKPGGLQAVSDFIESAVPQAERERAAGVLLRILNGCLFELDTLARAQNGEAPLDENAEHTRAFMTQAVLALSDATLYPAPAVFQLTGFKQIQASVFQVARAPGKNVVYLGALLLILGVFAMLYIRERRLWVWLTPSPSSGTHAMMALSSNRKTLDTDREFEELRREVFGAARDEESKKS